MADTRARRWLKATASWLFGLFLPAAIGGAIGYYHGNVDGRLEMKCAIFAAFDRLDGDKPPKSLMIGCDKFVRTLSPKNPPSRLPAHDLVEG